MFVMEDPRTRNNRIAKRRSRLNRQPSTADAARLASAIGNNQEHPFFSNTSNTSNSTASKQQHHTIATGAIRTPCETESSPEQADPIPVPPTSQSQQRKSSHDTPTVVDSNEHESVATMGDVVNNLQPLPGPSNNNHIPHHTSSSPEGNTTSTYTDATYHSSFFEPSGPDNQFTTSTLPTQQHLSNHSSSDTSAESVAHAPNTLWVESPLQVACTHGSLAAVQVLLEHGAKPSAVGDFMHIAAERGHIAILQLLAQHGASVFWTDLDGDTPVHRAAKAGQEEAVRVLADMGANLGARDYAGWTALHHAARVDNASMLKLLISLGAPAT